MQGGGDGVGGAVADGEEDVGMMEAGGGGGGEIDFGLALGVAEDFDVVPGELRSKAGAERLCDGLLGGKAPRKVGDMVFKFIAIILLALRKETIEKVLPMPL